jgi:hypothetical protein
MPTRATVKPYAGYRQFYLYDADSKGDTGSPEFWTEEALASRLPTQPGVVGVATDTYGEVPVTIEVLGSEPQVSLEPWDHVAETSLLLSGGRLLVAGCPDMPTDVTLSLTPGRYRLRVYSAGLTDDPNDLEYNGDNYLIQLWPSEDQDRVVLKRFAPSNTTG